jgi:hypothetical protein
LGLLRRGLLKMNFDEFNRLPATLRDLRNLMTARKSKSAPYQVGYGKPPRHAQFRKGKSGNPGGRPRRPVTEGAKALALQEAYRTITVKEGGRAFALPAIQAILRSQIELAANGNVQAQRAVLAAIQTIEDENVLAAKLAAIRAVPAQALVAPATIKRDCAEALTVAAHNAAHNPGGTMSYVQTAQRISTLLRRDEEKENPGSVAADNAGGTVNYVEAAQRIRTLLRLDEKKENPGSGEDERAAGAASSEATDAAGAKPGAVQVR